MWALAALAGTLMVWAAGMIAAFWLWGAAIGVVVSIGLSVLFWQQILMAAVLVVAAIALPNLTA